MAACSFPLRGCAQYAFSSAHSRSLADHGKFTHEPPIAPAKQVMGSPKIIIVLLGFLKYPIPLAFFPGVLISSLLVFRHLKLLTNLP
jgi:hypothetical protein